MQKHLHSCIVRIGLISLFFSIVLPCLATVRVIPLADKQIVQKQTTADLKFELPEIPIGQQVRLVMDVRVEYPSWCANNPAMEMAVNGSHVVGNDLLNKPLAYYVRNGGDSAWATPKGFSWSFTVGQISQRRERGRVRAPMQLWMRVHSILCGILLSMSVPAVTQFLFRTM